MEFGSAVRARLEQRLSTPGIPKYLHLVEVIEELVREGVLERELQLPAESVIASQIPLSLGTIQKAMSVLKRHGIVSRVHGRGTFVKGIPSELRDLWHFRFLDDDGQSILPVFPRVVSVETVGTDGPWAAFLNGGEAYVKVTREINVNNEFDALSEYFVSFNRCEGLLSIPMKELQRSHLRDVLRNRFGILTARVVEHVGCLPFSASVAEALGLPRKSLGLVCQILAFDFRDNPVSYHTIHVPANTRLLEMREQKP